MGDKTYTGEKLPQADPKRRLTGGPVTAQLSDPVDIHEAGNMAMQWLSGGRAASKFGSDPVKIRLDSTQPWLFTVEGNPTSAAITMELYGADVSMLLKKAEPIPLIVSEDAYEIVPELLLPSYRAQFHDAMRKILNRDVDFVEDTLLETWVSSDDEGTLMVYVSWWARRKDLRTESGQSYFDAFLARLKRDRWYRDYGLWKGSSAPLLDKLYSEVESRAGELNTLLAQNSVEFGAYRPAWLLLGLDGYGTGPQKKAEEAQVKINRELVERTAEIILSGLDGITWKGDSRVIRDTIVGLPALEQAAVLREIMSRYNERKWGIFGKYGEAWEGGMLYWLFEDLEPADRQLVTDSLKASGVLPGEIVDALEQGRGWGGKWLPFTTYKAHEATQFWADYAARHEDEAGGKAAAVMGSFSALWLPETAGTTVATLVTARAAPPMFKALGQAFPRVTTGLALLGTGVTSYNVTINVQEWVLEKDIWTGRQLSNEEVLARGLIALSGTLSLASSFASAFEADAPGPTKPPPGGGGFGPPRLVYSGPGRPATSPAQAPAASGSGGSRVVFVARGNTLIRVVISEPAPVAEASPASVPHLTSVPPQPAFAPTPAPALPVAPATAATAAVIGAVTTSVGAAPASAPAPGLAPGAPSGRTPNDAIRITWFKHPRYYPQTIELGGFEYSRDEPKTLPHGEPIGVDHAWWPRIGKTMLLIAEDRGPAADDFREVLRRRYGFDWGGLQADHVQDVMWEGPDSFENLWPMDSSANQSAGPRQNQLQRVTFRDDSGQVRSMTIQQGRDSGILNGRWFVIRDVQL